MKGNIMVQWTNLQTTYLCYGRQMPKIGPIHLALVGRPSGHQTISPADEKVVVLKFSKSDNSTPEHQWTAMSASSKLDGKTSCSSHRRWPHSSKVATKENDSFRSTRIGWRFGTSPIGYRHTERHSCNHFR